MAKSDWVDWKKTSVANGFYTAHITDVSTALTRFGLFY